MCFRGSGDFDFASSTPHELQGSPEPSAKATHFLSFYWHANTLSDM